MKLLFTKFIQFFECNNNYAFNSSCQRNENGEWMPGQFNANLLAHFFNPYPKKAFEDVHNGPEQVLKQINAQWFIKNGAWAKLKQAYLPEEEIELSDIIEVAKILDIPISNDANLEHHWHRINFLVNLDKADEPEPYSFDYYIKDFHLNFKTKNKRDYAHISDQELATLLTRFNKIEHTAPKGDYADLFLENTEIPSAEVALFTIESPWEFPDFTNDDDNSTRVATLHQMWFDDSEAEIEDVVAGLAEMSDSVDLFNKLKLSYALVTSLNRQQISNLNLKNYHNLNARKIIDNIGNLYGAKVAKGFVTQLTSLEKTAHELESTYEHLKNSKLLKNDEREVGLSR